MDPDPALTVEYHRPGEGGGCALRDWRDVLGLVRLSANGSSGDAAGVPVVHVADELGIALGPAAPVVFVRADVCRAELLVEIEAVGLGQARAQGARRAQ